jgi:hypothetical protein
VSTRTSGPWRIANVGFAPESIHCAIVAGPEGLDAHVIALVGKQDGGEGNAQVLVASLELLEALKRLESAAFSRDVTMGDPCRLFEVKAELDAAAKHARVVIAKVEGRS